ncbi:MAG: Gfo/Idh/MocA family oxidoreductase [Planctomycetota bacterium]
MQTDPMKVLVIGAGGMAGRHLRRLLEIDWFKVAAVAEAHPERDDAREGLALATAGGAKIFTDYRAMLDQMDSEAVFIGTPHFLHLPMIKAALERGRHVFCEKPVAPTVEACERIVRARDRSGRVVSIGFQHVGHANARWLKELIAGGGLGRIVEVVAVMPNYRPESYYERSTWVGKMKVGQEWCLDGALSNQMVHFINQSMFFASTRDAPHVSGLTPGSTVSALYRAHETPALEMDDLGVFRCRLEGDVRFFCVATTALLGGGTLTIEIVGEKGRALYDGRGIVWQNGREPTVHDEADEKDYLYENFYRAVRAGVAPLSPLDEAVKCVAVLESAFQAADYKIKKIRWEDCANLRELLHESAQYRCLFSELRDAPAWA